MTEAIDPDRARAAARAAMEQPGVRAALAQVPIAQRAEATRQMMEQIDRHLRAARPTSASPGTGDSR